MEIHEYQPAMVHAKVMIIDEAWTVLCSTNFDNRSFGLNDEINLAALDPELSATMTSLFAQDLKQAPAITYDEWKKRPVWERFVEMFGWLLERQE